jgi:hypothetical protein
MNIWGNQNARTGNGYAEIAVYGSSGPSIRDYVQVQLTSPMVAGHLYCVEFYVSQAGISSYVSMYTPIAVSQIGLFLSPTAVSSSTSQPLPYSPQIVSPVGIVITDTIGWTKISGVYTAVGGEKYITIGNFKTDALTDTLVVGRPGYDPQGYYYVDDVSIINCDSLAGVPDNSNIPETSIFPNPSDGNMTLKYNWGQNEPGTLKIFDLTGRLVYSMALNPGNNEAPLSLTLSPGIYFYQVTNHSRIVAADKLIISSSN